MEPITKENLTQVYLLVVLCEFVRGIKGMEFIGKFYTSEDAEEAMLKEMISDTENWRRRVYSIIPSYER